MKTALDQAKTAQAERVLVISSIFFSACLILLLNFSIPAQADPKARKPTKDFGKSLKQYEKKPERTNEQAKKVDSPDDDVIRVETNMVVTDVLVVNQKGNALVGLGKDDFIITENDVPQEMELFSLGRNTSVPKSIVLILDYSGSMRPYISNSVAAAKILIDKLGPGDRLALVTDDVELITDYSSDKALLRSKLDSLKNKALGRNPGRSEQYTALMASLNELFSDEDIRPIVIFQADGDEFPLLKPMDVRLTRFYKERKFSFEDVKSTVERSRATIYSVIPGVRFFGLPREDMIPRGVQAAGNILGQMPGRPNEKHMDEQSKRFAAVTAEEQLRRQGSMFEVARISGGYTSFLEKAEDADGIYDSIFKVIENRYVIGYYPKNDARDGKRRSVKIEVKGHPEYLVLGRKTYFAPKE